jgi:diguanylate cyclase (GGDEF)-like protein/PAS domain S-box-containing protein
LHKTVQNEQLAVERWLAERGQDMRALAQAVAEFRDADGSFRAMLARFKAGHPDFDGLAAADASGRLTADAGEIGEADMPGAETLERLRGGADTVALVRAAASSGSSVRIVFGSPVYDPRGQFMGAVFGAANVQRLVHLTDDAAEWRTQRMYVVAPDGDIVYGVGFGGEPLFDGVAEPVSLAGTSLFPPSEVQDPRSRLHKDYRGVAVYSAARWTNDGSFILMRTIDRTEVVASVLPMVHLMALLLMVTMIPAWFAVRWMAGRLFRPLSELQQAVQTMRKGTSEAGRLRSPGADMFGEWKTLFDAYAAMANDLASVRRELAAVGGGAEACGEEAGQPGRTGLPEQPGRPPRADDPFRELFLSAGIGLAVVDSSGRFVEMNPTLQDMLGYAKNEFLQNRLAALVAELAAGDGRERGSPNRSNFIERRIYHKDGSQIWVRMTITDLKSFAGRNDCRMLVFEDITQHKRALEELEESENLYRSLVDLSPDAVMVHIDGIFMYVNEKAVQLLGCTRVEDILFKPLLNFIAPSDHRAAVEVIRELCQHGQPKLNIEARFLRLDGRVIDVELSASLVSYHHKQAILMLARDVTERKRNEEQIRRINELLQKLSSTDGLTNLANRRTFDTMLEKEWRRALRSNAPLALILLDIDDFKPFNDTYGHLGGDQVLKEIAGVLSRTARREGDLAVRYGGEEFALLLPNTDEAGAERVAEHILHEVERLRIPHAGSEIAPYVTVSIGVAAMVPQPQTTPRLLVERADQALYMAKREGRNRVRRYHPGGGP